MPHLDKLQFAACGKGLGIVDAGVRPAEPVTELAAGVLQPQPSLAGGHARAPKFDEHSPTWGEQLAGPV